MVADDRTATLAALKEGADRALRSANPTAAYEQFQRAVALAPDRVDLWMGLAASQRVLGDLTGALDSIRSALTAEPRFFPALLMKGSLLEALGQKIPATAAYDAAVKLAPPLERLTEPARRALAHAKAVHEHHVGELAACLKAEAGLAGLAPESVLGRRVDTFIEAMVGRRRIYRQEPSQFHYPGLPAIEFHEREAFPWLEALEARTGAIRKEVLTVLAEDTPELTPYIHYPAGMPIDQWAELNHSLRWSAFHFYLEGAPVEANCARCPETMAAIALIDQPEVHGRSPAAMYSILRPHTRIPPHTGVANTRLVLHLPLVVPEGCRFRVGGETRPWRVGEAWVFDDTIEHEAWNDSDEARAILICDVWSPALGAEERELVARLTAAVDRFNGGGAGGEL